MKIIEKVLDRLLTTPDEARALTRVSGSPTPAHSGGRVADTPARAATGPNTVYLLLDVSQSMDEHKLRQAREGGLSFAEDAIRKGYQVGVIQFSTWGRLTAEPTTDLDVIGKGLVPRVRQMTTNMGLAINFATASLRQIERQSALVLVTDGYPDLASHALVAASTAKRRGITIIAIGTEDADYGFLKRIATASELATTVPDQDLGQAIAKAAGLLPARTASSK